MKNYTIAFLVLISFNFYGQELKEDTKMYLNELNRQFKDTLKSYNPRRIFEIGYKDEYYGNYSRGEELMQYGMRNMQDLTPEDIRHSSVQNTKNGFFVQAIEKLNRACVLDPKIHGYYGWVLLFFYHDYQSALDHFEIYDNLTPDFSDVENGDDIHYLKGIALMKLDRFVDGIKEFDKSKAISIARSGDFNYPFQLQLYKGICLDKIGKHKEAIQCYTTATKIAVQADNFFYTALSYKKLKKRKKYLQNLKIAHKLILKGWNQQDNYQEVFYEIYLQDVENEIALNL